MPASDFAPCGSRDLGDGEVDVVAARPVGRLAQVDEPIAVAMRQRLEQHAAHDAEDRRVRADAERRV